MRDDKFYPAVQRITEDTMRSFGLSPMQFLTRLTDSPIIDATLQAVLYWKSGERMPGFYFLVVTFDHSPDAAIREWARELLHEQRPDVEWKA